MKNKLILAGLFISFASLTTRAYVEADLNYKLSQQNIEPASIETDSIKTDSIDTAEVRAMDIPDDLIEPELNPDYIRSMD